MNLRKLWTIIRLTNRNAQIRNDKWKTGCYWVIENRVLILSFQDTSSAFLDWLMNLMHFSVGGVHAGFLMQTLPIYRQVRRVLSAEKPNYSSVVLTGFSQGAAIAAIFADFWIKKRIVHPSKITCYLFGGPRPFRLWKPVNIPGVHYKNGGDIVTMVPTRLMLYRHGIRPTQLRKRRFFFPSVRDHLPAGYKEAIWAMEQ